MSDREEALCATTTKLYVGNLPKELNQADLESTFAFYGEVKKLWVARNPPGFAFVDYVEKRDAENAMEGLNGSNFAGSTIKVEIASDSKSAGRRGHPGREQRRDFGAHSRGRGRDQGGRHYDSDRRPRSRGPPDYNEPRERDASYMSRGDRVPPFPSRTAQDIYSQHQMVDSRDAYQPRMSFEPYPDQRMNRGGPYNHPEQRSRAAPYSTQRSERGPYRSRGCDRCGQLDACMCDRMPRTRDGSHYGDRTGREEFRDRDQREWCAPYPTRDTDRNMDRRRSRSPLARGRPRPYAQRRN